MRLFLYPAPTNNILVTYGALRVLLYCIVLKYWSKATAIYDATSDWMWYDVSIVLTKASEGNYKRLSNGSILITLLQPKRTYCVLVVLE